MEFLVSAIAQYLIFVVAAAAVAFTLLSEKRVRNKIIALAILSFILAIILDRIAGWIYYDPRPFVAEHIQPLFPHAADNGFPSEHTLAAMVVAAVIFLYSRKMGIILGICAILIGITRVLSEVHHPVDIIASIVIAIISTAIAWVVLRILENSPHWASLIKYARSFKPNSKH
jgi:undecaprenyl-diphosphatase